MEQNDVTVSVIVCVYTMDRWDDICDAIQSIRDQTLTPLEILIVVDYNPVLLAAATAGFPDARVIANRQARGLSGGRNTGASEAEGSVLAYLDDDAVADPDWLRILIGHCLRPEVLGAGSSVAAIWRGARPSWFPDEFLWTVGCSFRGAPTHMQTVRNVQGGSMVLKRELFDAIDGFSIHLGRQGSKVPISCEETELCIRAHEAMPDRVFVFDPASVVWHKVPASRLTWRYFCLRCYAEGRSKAILAARMKSSWALETERGYLMRALVPGVLRYLGRAVTRLDGSELMKAAAIVVGVASAAVGFVDGRLRHERRRPSGSVAGATGSAGGGLFARRKRLATASAAADAPGQTSRAAAAAALTPGVTE